MRESENPNKLFLSTAESCGFSILTYSAEDRVNVISIDRAGDLTARIFSPLFRILPHEVRVEGFIGILLQDESRLEYDMGLFLNIANINELRRHDRNLLDCESMREFLDLLKNKLQNLPKDLTDVYANLNAGSGWLSRLNNWGDPPTKAFRERLERRLN